MLIDTNKAFAIAALIVATGVSAVELTRDTAHAGAIFPTDQASYTNWRVDAAFDAVAKMPPAAPFSLPLAMKGDLPVPLGCASATGDVQAECMDVAYEPDTGPSLVVETRTGSTSTLLRMDAMAVAGLPAGEFQQSE